MTEFSEHAARRIINATRRIEQIPVGQQSQRPAPTRFAPKIFQGFLKADLAAPSNPIGPPTSAVVREYERAISDNTLVYAREKTVYNYSRGLEAEEGTAVMYTKVNGLLQFIWVDCDPALLTIDDEDGESLEDESGTWIFADV